MYQQQVPQPREEGNWSSAGGDYQGGYAGSPEQRDQLADAIARRLQPQIPPPGVQLPINMPHINTSKATAVQRMVLAIVSVAILVPLSGIALPVLGPFAGLVALGVLCAAILGINLIFNVMN